MLCCFDELNILESNHLTYICPYKHLMGTKSTYLYHKLVIDILESAVRKIGLVVRVNPFYASGDFCHQMITFANNLDPDQDQHVVGPDLDPNRLHPDCIPERIFQKS